MSSPFMKDVVVLPPSEVVNPSAVSLHLMVKNGESVVARLIDNVAPYVSEVVAVLNDCSDKTEDLLVEKCAERKLPLYIHSITSETHPELYILDTEDTYRDAGPSLVGEEMSGPFMESKVLADWSAARNVGWNNCHGKWRLFLDADDVVMDPTSIPGIVQLLEENGAELAASSYEYSVDADGRPKGSSFRERLALNTPRIKWVKKIHEVLAGTARIAHIKGNLVVRDMRDSTGAGIRIPGRNFKILYYNAKLNNWELSPRHYADLIQETRYVSTQPLMLDFANEILKRYERVSTWPEELGWVTALVGEMHEANDKNVEASDLYVESLKHHPGVKTAFRLCRVLFKIADEMKKAGDPKDAVDECWRSCIDAYNRGVENKVVHQVLDDGSLFEEMEKIHVACAYYELGDLENARKFAREAAEAFPNNSALAFMVEQFVKAADLP